MSILNS